MKSIKVNYGVRCAAEAAKGHNRWHCAIPPALEAEPGEEVELETATRSTVKSPRRAARTICSGST